MRRTTFLSLLLAGGLLLAAAEAPAAPAFKVVVNSANGASSMTRDEVARLFLKKTTTWPGGAQPVQPVDQSRESAVRKAFTKAVLGRDVATVESFWQQAIFSGRAVPPVEKGSDADVLSFVRSNPNAVGYVSGGADLGASVKELVVN